MLSRLDVATSTQFLMHCQLENIFWTLFSGPNKDKQTLLNYGMV